MAKKTPQTLLHARHNKEVCDHIDSTSSFSDWVITTSFYAALHYFRHKLFPLKINLGNGQKVPIRCFDDYCLYQKYQLGSKVPKHVLLVNLVTEKLPEISSDYNWLYDTCRTARYKNYKLSKELSGTAKKKLENIRKICDN